uniref:Cadherin domain-containing protein n=1 Tax=Nothoprocta perdicaria TaxID=30464 RepID=A0A8C7EFB6_NOTPE
MLSSIIPSWEKILKNSTLIQREERLWLLTDSGPNGQLNYEIVDGNTENSFSISRATGEIRSIRPLDREKLSQYTLTIKASDKGTPLQSTTVKVVINILDENDNAPRFSQIFSASVPENAPLGFTVTRVTTSDEDVGVNAVSSDTSSLVIEYKEHA